MIIMLNSTFVDDASLLKLEWTSTGIGVLARNDLQIIPSHGDDCFHNNYDTRLSAKYRPLVEGVDW